MNKTKAVDDFFEKFENPRKTEMMKVRDIILASSDKITESIKWSAPSFAYKENMATFNPRAKKFVNLTFHKGALIKDETGLLVGDKPEARVARFNDMAEVEARKADLEKVVLKWIATMDAE